MTLEHLYHKPCLSAREVFDGLRKQRGRHCTLCGDTFQFLREAQAQGKRILLEGQLGAMKDPDFEHLSHGDLLSSTLAGYGAIGAGLPPYAITDIVCVVKAYSSAVGAGALSAKFLVMRLRSSGFVAVTRANSARPPVGPGAWAGLMRWQPATVSRSRGRLRWPLTVVDALGYLKEIPVCVGYEVDGKTCGTSQQPHVRAVQAGAGGFAWLELRYSGTTRYEDLPANCRAYVEFIEKEMGVPITMVSNGPGRTEVIYR